MNIWNRLQEDNIKASSSPSPSKKEKNNNLIIVTSQNLSENKAPRGEGMCFLFPILKAHTGINSNGSEFVWNVKDHGVHTYKDQQLF